MEQNRIFLEEMPAAQQAFPLFTRVTSNGVDILRGPYELYADDGSYVDTYEIEIHPSKQYPKRYPLVYETGGRLPHNIDWHVYEAGHWCISTPIEERLACSTGITLSTFISNEVRSFLFSQVYRREKGFFYRERSHGAVGILESYMDLLQLPSLEVALSAVRVIATLKEPKSTAKCFCGSNRKYKKCHRRRIRYLRKAAMNTVQNDFQSINSFLEQFKTQL